MHFKLINDTTAQASGSIIYAYFEPGFVGLVFEKDREGFDWGGRPDDEMPDLFWFKLVGDRLVVGEEHRPWELIS